MDQIPHGRLKKKKKRKVALQKEAEIASNHEDLRKIEKKTLI